MRPETDPDVGWVAALSGASIRDARSAVDEAAGERALFRHLAREHRSEGRCSYIEIDAPLELFALVRLMRPRHIVEVGVSSGVSSAYLLAALHANGQGTLHSVDLPSPERFSRHRPGGASWSLPTGRGSGWAVPLALRARWDLRLGDKRRVLPVLGEELPSIGLLVYDVPHECGASRREFLSLDPLFGERSVAIVDHGPGGTVCPALRTWATRRGTPPVGRQGLGLYGARFDRRNAAGRRGGARKWATRPAASRAHRPGASDGSRPTAREA